MKNSLTPGQTAVLLAFYEHGPMHDAELATYVHHHSEVNMSSSGVRTRRSELTRMQPPLVTAWDTRRMAKSGRNAVVHALTGRGHAVVEDLLLADSVV